MAGEGSETGAGLMALGEIAAVERVVSEVCPAAIWVLEPRFARLRVMVETLDSLVNGYLADESRRIDELGQQEDLSADAKLRADLTAHYARAVADAQDGQGTLLAEPSRHRDPSA